MRGAPGRAAACEPGGTADPSAFRGSSRAHGPAPLPVSTPAGLSRGWVCCLLWSRDFSLPSPPGSPWKAARPGTPRALPRPVPSPPPSGCPLPSSSSHCLPHPTRCLRSLHLPRPHHSSRHPQRFVLPPTPCFLRHSGSSLCLLSPGASRESRGSAIAVPQPPGSARATAAGAGKGAGVCRGRASRSPTPPSRELGAARAMSPRRRAPASTPAARVSQPPPTQRCLLHPAPSEDAGREQGGPGVRPYSRAG